MDPFLSRSIGFALSVLACAGIVWWARRWTVIINRWLPHIIAESIAVPLAAQLATHAGGGGDLGTGERLRPRRQRAGRSVRRSCDGAGLCRGRRLADQRTLAAVCGFGAAWCAQLIIWIARPGFATCPALKWHLPVTPLTTDLAGRQLAAARPADGVSCSRGRGSSCCSRVS